MDVDKYAVSILGRKTDIMERDARAKTCGGRCKQQPHLYFSLSKPMNYKDALGGCRRLSILWK